MGRPHLRNTISSLIGLHCKHGMRLLLCSNSRSHFALMGSYKFYLIICMKMICNLICSLLLNRWSLSSYKNTEKQSNFLTSAVIEYTYIFSLVKNYKTYIIIIAYISGRTCLITRSSISLKKFN